uniref:Uncharacterized protein n=1 Tax=Magallana gigas TaxID=29159 RepID=A0A8W8LIF8_MAGGI
MTGLSIACFDFYMTSGCACPASCLGKLILLSSYLLLLLIMSPGQDFDRNEFLRSTRELCSSTSNPCHFLRSFGKVRLPASPEFAWLRTTQMLKRFRSICGNLDPIDLFIYHHGLSAFTKFAEETLHEAVVPSCIEDQPGFRTVWCTETSVEELVGVLRETLSDLEAFTKSEDTDMTHTTWNNLEHIQTKIMDIMKEKGDCSIDHEEHPSSQSSLHTA